MQIKHDAQIKKLCEVIAGLKTPEDAALVLDDLCTIQEISALSQRLQVAYLLHGGMNYTEINSTTGVSTATISRVNRCLNYGSGGYKIALEIMKEDGNDN